MRDRSNDSDRVSRGMRDEAGVGPNPDAAVNLVPMRDLDRYTVAEGEPDIRGWSVFTATGRELGEVEDLLVDTESDEVVMIDIDLKRNDRHSMAPIRAAWIDREHRRVVLNTSAIETDDDVPALARQPASAPEDRARFNQQYERVYGDEGWQAGRDISIRRANDDIRITRRTPPPPSELSGRPAEVPHDRPAARAIDRVGDTVERGTDRASDAIDREPRRDVDRTADRGAAGTAAGRQVRYAQQRDEVVIERRPVVMEEVVVRRRVVDPSELEAGGTDASRPATGHDPMANRPPSDERR